MAYITINWLTFVDLKVCTGDQSLVANMMHDVQKENYSGSNSG